MSGLRSDDRFGQRVKHYFPFLLLIAILMGFLGTGIYFISHEVGQKNTTVTPEPKVIIRESPQRATDLVISYQNAVKQASPAVVNIYTTQKVQSPAYGEMLDDPVFRRFFGSPQQQNDDGPMSQQATSLGSGVIVTPDGYILTNNHVVARADEIVVALSDGRRADAKVIGTDPDTDLAVIRINLKSLPTITLRSTPAQVGDVVLAIGNPFGVGQTVTQGIVSATGRTGLGINTYEDFIQTDAAINPGNSGGALTDSTGQLIGINSAIFSRSGGNMGIGFAIPTRLAQKVLEDIIKNGSVTRGWLGIEVGPATTDILHPEKQQPGVVVEGILSKGPAARSGIEPGDRIIKIRDELIHSPSQLMSTIASIKPGDTVNVEVLRNEKPKTLAVKVEARPKSQARQQLPAYNDE